jgi:hypothetical protein
MANIANENVEILIRAGASSRPQDDARYRAMVTAYLTFDPINRQPVDIAETVEGILDEQAGSQLQDDLARSAREERDSAESWHPDVEEYGTSASQEVDIEGPASMSFMDSPQMSFQSVLHNIDSPLFRRQTRKEEVIPATDRRMSMDSKRSWEPLQSVVVDSQAESSLRLSAFVSPTTALEEYYSRITNRVDSSESISVASMAVKEVRRSTRIRATQKSSSSVLKVTQSSSPAELPSSPSPNKTSDRTARVLRRLENGASPPKILPAKPTREVVQTSTSTPYPETQAPILDVPQRAGTNANEPGSSPPAVSPSLKSRLEASGKYRVISPVATRMVEKRQLPNTLSSATMSYAFQTSALLSPPQIKRRRVETEKAVPLFLAPPPLVGPPVSNSSLPLPLPPAPEPNHPRSSPAPSLTQPNIPQPASSTDLATSSAPSTVSPYHNSLTINPTSPKASHHTLKPNDLITPFFRQLLTRMSADNPFTPLSRTRPLRPFERGHWSLKCTPWTEELRIRAWDALGNFVGRDMAGWGVRCVRDEKREWIRVYCWGETVECVWFMLFLVSEGKIRGCEHAWIGGDGKSVIIMK